MHAKARARKLPSTATERRGWNGNIEESWIFCRKDHEWLPQTKLQETGALHTETDATSANVFVRNKEPISRSWSPDKVHRFYTGMEGVLALLHQLLNFCSKCANLCWLAVCLAVRWAYIFKKRTPAAWSLVLISYLCQIAVWTLWRTHVAVFGSSAEVIHW